MAKALHERLAAIAGQENVFTAGELFDACSKDATEIRFPPAAAVLIRAAGIIPGIVELARELKLPLIARGAGTGLSGGSLAERGGIILALHELNQIISVDSKRRVAVVEPGVITQDLADSAADLGLFYPPDPASVAESTLGGNVAECAGGLQCKKYGVTKDYILGIEGYDGEGRLVQTGYFAENELYDLTSILIGSEGTLLIITKIAVALIDPPQQRISLLATFARQEDAALVVARILEQGVTPAVLEFMDSDALSCACEYLMGQGELSDEERTLADDSAEALLLIELDGEQDEITSDLHDVKRIIDSQHPVKIAETAAARERERLWLLRRSLSRAVTAAAPVRVSEDVCVPPSRLPVLVSLLPDLAERFRLRVNSYGHAGDGNLHVNFLSAHDTEDARASISRAVAELFRKTLALGGTISGEHGIGICKRAYLQLEVSPVTIDVYRRVKRSFDPAGVINPGKMFSESS